MERKSNTFARDRIRVLQTQCTTVHCSMSFVDLSNTSVLNHNTILLHLTLTCPRGVVIENRTGISTTQCPRVNHHHHGVTLTISQSVVLNFAPKLLKMYPPFRATAHPYPNSNKNPEFERVSTIQGDYRTPTLNFK